MVVTVVPTPKQHQAYQILQNNFTKFLAFGGGAGGGKSWLGCEWLLTNCYFYPGTRYFMGREELKRLKDSTLVTFYKVCKHHNIPQEDYRFNGQDNFIQFENGSRIDLLDLKYLPSDPLYERYGSVEYTSGWIEEGGEVDFNAFDTLKSRVGRCLNDKYGLLGKILITCNPKKNWLYGTFYKPHKNGDLPKDYAFIQALVTDNKHGESSYRENLVSISDESKKQRLLYGNWEYDDDPNTLINFEAIRDLFSNTVEESSKKYLVIDAARYGGDKIVFSCWKGLECYKIITKVKQGIDVTASDAAQIAKDEGIPWSQCLVDEDGVGGGIIDINRGMKGFVNNSSPLEDPRYANDSSVPPPNYQNLKTQCSFILAEKINNHEMAVRTQDAKLRDELTEELEQIKSKDTDKDQKLKIVPKDEVKEIIGRSPDIADVLMMRMFFELQPVTQTKKPSTHLPNPSSTYGIRSNQSLRQPSLSSSPY